MSFLFKADKRDWGDFMDIVQAATDGRVTGSVGHPKRYFSGRLGKIKQATEAFAEMYAAEISNPESLKNLQTVAPNAYKVFRRMVTALEKKMRKG
jgi:heme oxygenase